MSGLLCDRKFFIFCCGEDESSDAFTLIRLNESGVGTFEIVVERPATAFILSRTETCGGADVGDADATIRLMEDLMLEETFESSTSGISVGGVEQTEPCTLHEYIGEHGGGGGLSVVVSGAEVVDSAIDEIALTIGGDRAVIAQEIEPEGCGRVLTGDQVGGHPRENVEQAVAVGVLSRHEFDDIDKSAEIPAHCAAPEFGVAAFVGFRLLGPERVRVIGSGAPTMIIEMLGSVICHLVEDEELVGDVRPAFDIVVMSEFLAPFSLPAGVDSGPHEETV